MDIDAATKQQIVVAAMSAVGPVGEDSAAWESEVARTAARFTAVAGNDQHPAFRAVEQVAAAKVFTGTVVSIVKEQSSTRGLITLHTGTERSDDGTESVRTERTDNPVGLAMAKQVRSLVGHKVVVWIEVETMKNGNKSRVLRHIEDRGEATENAA
ncbi:hypothetical protein [Isoptericola croceus]|uniref:hypothetical protein n=1 Tax=Isoptericola croceus TaxID=3031406 RepID=UPI0023F7A836|nr:hypothetical protein [Isoptericola croceus]